MKVYITKYALTSGIEYIEASKAEFSPSMVTSASNSMCHFHGDEWHTSFQSAKAKAESMRDNRIKSLNKQLNKLHAMKFEDPA